MKPEKGQDPYRKREKRRYVEPIASREHIDEVLQQAAKPLTVKQLARQLGMPASEARVDALSKRVWAMVRDGQIEAEDEKFNAINKADLIAGKVQGHADGFGFLIREDDGEDLFLGPRQMRQVFDGDQVQVSQRGYNARGKPEGVIHWVSHRAHQFLAGRCYSDSGKYYLEPANSRISQQLLLETGQELPDGQWVVVEIIDYPTMHHQALAKVTEVLGGDDQAGIEVDVALHRFDIPHQWPKSVLDEVGELPPEVVEQDKTQRVDLRDLPLVTIDGEDARDFDDAVFCEKLPRGGWRLVVAIADVANYVGIETALDKEASLRGNSVYFPQRVIPMLPELLSNGLCSLNPKVDRLAMVCDMRVSAEGKVSRYQFYEAVICSHARLTYTQVAAVLEESEGEQASDFRAQQPELEPPLQNLFELYQLLLNRRELRGAIDFATTETSIRFNSRGKIEQIVPVQRNTAHRIIEECMLAANVCTAKFLASNKVPTLFRVHDKPKLEKLEALQQYLAEFGIRLLAQGKQLKDVAPSDYQQAMSRVLERPDYQSLQVMLLRSMPQAVYGPDNLGHFGLAYDAYTHFTSPIRRYPDLLVHRAIKAMIYSESECPNVRRVKAGSGTVAQYYPYDVKRIGQAGENCSLTERRADEATRDVMSWLKCQYMAEHVGAQFDGRISAVMNFGLFVELQDFYIEGLVHISGLQDDYYNFDSQRQWLVGERSGKRFAMGDMVKVQLAAVNVDERKIDLSLVGMDEFKRSDGRKKSGKKSQTKGPSDKKNKSKIKGGGGSKGKGKSSRVKKTQSKIDLASGAGKARKKPAQKKGRSGSK